MEKTTKLTVPTYLTIARIILVIPFVLALSIGGKGWMTFALILFIVASITDFFDGYLARKLGKTSEIGAFLDPLADKMLVDAALIGFVARDMIPFWMAAIFICRDFAVDGIRMVAAKKGVTVAAALSGKCKTFVQMTAIIVLLLGNAIASGWVQLIGSVLIYGALLLSVYSGYQYVYYGWKKFFK